VENGNTGSRANRFLPHSVDHLGRPIGPDVFRIAQEIAPRAVSYGNRVLGDSAVAMTLFEEAAASVSRTLGEDIDSGPHVREMRRYLFRSYLRRISTARRTEPCLICASEHFRNSSLQDAEVRKIETAVVLREVLDRCDGMTRAILQRRLEGCSWKQIEREFGISANAAALRLRRTVRNLRTASTYATAPATRPSLVPRSAVLPQTIAKRLLRAS
jgi:DNA-directed RNA polymerase specialized sigma24 family protein